MKRQLFVLFFLLYTALCSAQFSEWGMEFKPKFGFLLAHRGVMGHLPREHVVGGEFSVYARPDGSKNWHHAYRFPRVGLTFFASNAGNKAVLGNYVGSYAFIEFPFVKTEKHNFFGKLGSGVGYGTKVFDQQLNPKNVAISSHLNVMICLGLQYRYSFGMNHLVTGIDLTHFSNASTKVPNLGLNLPFFSLGYGRTMRKTEQKNLETPFERQKWKFDVLGVVSMKEVFPTERKKYGILAFSLKTSRQFRPKTGVEFSADVFYKTSNYVYREDLYPNKSALDIIQMGVFAGYVLPLDKLSFVLGMGTYVRDKYNPNDRFYHRIGMRYQCSKHVGVHLVLKSHWAKADYAEYGISYTF